MKRVIEWLVPVAIVAIALKFFKFQDVFGFFSEGVVDGVQSSVEVAKRVGVDWSKVHKTESQIIGIANTQELAMQNSGTDEASLFSSLVGLSAEELKAVNEKFGVRE